MKICNQRHERAARLEVKSRSPMMSTIDHLVSRPRATTPAARGSGSGAAIHPPAAAASAMRTVATSDMALDANQWFERGQLGGTDAGHGEEIVDRAKAAV